MQVYDCIKKTHIYIDTFSLQMNEYITKKQHKGVLNNEE